MIRSDQPVGAEGVLRVSNVERAPVTSSEEQQHHLPTTPLAPMNPQTPVSVPLYTPPISYMVRGLHEQTLRDLVYRLAQTQPWIAAELTMTWNMYRYPRQQGPLVPTQNPTVNNQNSAFGVQQPVITIDESSDEDDEPPAEYDFDYLSKRAWHALNSDYICGLSSSEQFEAADDVWSSIETCVATIQRKCRKSVTLRTRQSAIETLRKISKTVLLSEDTVGHEVRKIMQFKTCIADVRIEVLEEMEPEDMIATGKRTDGKGSLISKMKWVREEARGYCLDGFNGLDDVLEMLEKGEVEEEDDSGAGE